jgi:hypothetical protein
VVCKKNQRLFHTSKKPIDKKAVCQTRFATSPKSIRRHIEATAVLPNLSVLPLVVALYQQLAVGGLPNSAPFAGGLSVSLVCLDNLFSFSWLKVEALLWLA